MLPQRAKATIPLGLVRREHPPFAGGNDLPRMEREARDVCMGLTNAFPLPGNLNFASNRTSRILNNWQSVLRRDLVDCHDVTGHSHLMHTEDCSRPRCDCGLDQAGVDVKGIGSDIHEDRRGTAVSDTVSCRNEGVADSYNLIPWFNSYRK
jgi:hypothetical protein